MKKQLITCLLLCLSLFSSIQGISYDHVFLDEIDWTCLHCIDKRKLSHIENPETNQHIKNFSKLINSDDRNVFYADDHYYKIWGKNYKGKKKFKVALDVGFFKEISPLTAVIYDRKGNCFGYITRRCVSCKIVEYHNLPDENAKVNSFCQDPQYKQKCDALFNKLIEKSKKTNLFYNDFMLRRFKSEVHQVN